MIITFLSFEEDFLVQAGFKSISLVTCVWVKNAKE